MSKKVIQNKCEPKEIDETLSQSGYHTDESVQDDPEIEVSQNLLQDY